MIQLPDRTLAKTDILKFLIFKILLNCTFNSLKPKDPQNLSLYNRTGTKTDKDSKQTLGVQFILMNKHKRTHAHAQFSIILLIRQTVKLKV